MRNLLVIIVGIAIYLHFYPQPQLEAWYIEQKTQFLNLFAESTDTRVKLKSDKIYTDLMPQFNHFTIEEQRYLQEMTLTRQSVRDFYNEYCQKKQRHFKFHIKNQELVCNTINKYSNLL